MRLIDAHLHVWDPERFDYPWLAEVPALHRRLTLEELDEAFPRESGDDVGFVFVQADCVPGDALAEVDWVSTMTGEGVVGIVAFAALERGDEVAGELEALAERDLVVGVRRLLQSEPAGFALEPGFIAGARRLAAAGLTFDACVVESQIVDVAGLADAVPELSIMLDHLGKPDIDGGDFAAWRAAIGELAKRPNVVAKLSGLPGQTTPEWDDATVRPYLDAALEAFGAERLAFGSDWPASSQQTSYPRWLMAVEAWAATLGEDAADGILFRTAAEFYGL